MSLPHVFSLSIICDTVCYQSSMFLNVSEAQFLCFQKKDPVLAHDYLLIQLRKE